MIERGGRARFLLEPAQPIGVTGERRRQDLDGDVAAEPRVARAIDLAHAARTDGVDDFVGAKARSWRQHHQCAPAWARSVCFKKWHGAPPPCHGGSSRCARSPQPPAPMPPAPMALRISYEPRCVPAWRGMSGAGLL